MQPQRAMAADDKGVRNKVCSWTGTGYAGSKESTWLASSKRGPANGGRRVDSRRAALSRGDRFSARDDPAYFIIPPGTRRPDGTAIDPLGQRSAGACSWRRRMALNSTAGVQAPLRHFCKFDPRLAIKRRASCPPHWFPPRGRGGEGECTKRCAACNCFPYPGSLASRPRIAAASGSEGARARSTASICSQAFVTIIFAVCQVPRAEVSSPACGSPVMFTRR
jgi:hypothetical protein